MRIEKNHWFITGNELSMSLNRLYVKISTVSHRDKVYCRLSVIDSNMSETIFLMNSIEEAVYFVENHIYYLKNLDEVAQEYARVIAETKEKGRSR